MIRLNITMPEDVIKQMEGVKNKSRFIAQAVVEKIERDRNMKLQALMKEGYIASAEDDRDIASEWDSTVDDQGWD